jgi:hypothetical protein
VGIGSLARRTYGASSPLAGMTAYMLFVLTHAVRAAVETQTRLNERLKLNHPRPMEIDVALPGAEGAILSGFADGWAIPEYDLGQLSHCVETDPLVRPEVPEWPDEDHQGELVQRVAQRICDSNEPLTPLPQRVHYRQRLTQAPGDNRGEDCQEGGE